MLVLTDPRIAVRQHRDHCGRLREFAGLRQLFAYP